VDGPSNIQPLGESIGKACGGVQCDVAQAIKLANDHQLYQLVDADRPTGGRVIFLMIGLVDQISAE